MGIQELFQSPWNSWICPLDLFAVLCSLHLNATKTLLSHRQGKLSMQHGASCDLWLLESELLCSAVTNGHISATTNLATTNVFVSKTRSIGNKISMQITVIATICRLVERGAHQRLCSCWEKTGPSHLPINLPSHASTSFSLCVPIPLYTCRLIV